MTTPIGGRRTADKWVWSFTTATLIAVITTVVFAAAFVVSRAGDIESEIVALRRSITSLERRVAAVESRQTLTRDDAIRKDVEVTNIKDDIKEMKRDLRTLLDLVRRSRSGG